MSKPKITEFVDDSGRTVGLAAFGVDGRDLLNQCLILQRTGPWALTSPIPVIEPAGRNLEVGAKRRDGMVGSHRVNPFVAFPDGSERMPNVFLECAYSPADHGSPAGPLPVRLEGSIRKHGFTALQLPHRHPPKVAINAKKRVKPNIYPVLWQGLRMIQRWLPSCVPPPASK